MVADAAFDVRVGDSDQNSIGLFGVWSRSPMEFHMSTLLDSSWMICEKKISPASVQYAACAHEKDERA
jgi:hypothetical protein